MRWLILALIFVHKFNCYAATDELRAMQHIQKAALKYSYIKSNLKDAEKEFFDYLPLSRENAAYFGSLAMIGVSGQVNTRKLKNLNVGFFGGKLRPDIVYDFRTKETYGLVFINWNF